MERLKHVNRSNVIRKVMLKGIDRVRAMRISEDMKRLRAKTTGRWSGVEEVRRWRELRR